VGWQVRTRKAPTADAFRARGGRAWALSGAARRVPPGGTQARGASHG
jgi:hypothetical protein